MVVSSPTIYCVEWNNEDHIRLISVKSNFSKLETLSYNQKAKFINKPNGKMKRVIFPISLDTFKTHRAEGLLT